LLPAGVDVHYAGNGLLFEELNRISLSNGTVLVAVSFVVVVIFLLLILRNRLRLLFAVALISLNLTVCMGLFAFSGKGISMLTMVLPSLVLTYSVCDIVHFMNYLDSFSTEHVEFRQRFREVFGHISIPCFVTSATTAFGFLSLTVSNIPVVRELGLFAAISILASYFVTFLLLALFFEFLSPMPGRVRMLEKVTRVNTNSIRSHRKTILLIPVILVLSAGAGVFRLRIDTFTLGFLPERSVVYRDSEWIENNFGNYVPLEFTVDFGSSGMTDADLLKIDQLTKEAKRRYLCDRTITIFSVFGQDRIPSTRRLSDRLLRVIPAELRHAWLSDDGNKMRISFMTKMMSAKGFEEAIREIRATTDLPLKPEGYVPLYVYMVRNIAVTQLESFLFAFVSVFLIIFLVSRSLRIGLAALAANLVPIAVVLGLMGWTGINLDIATATIAAVALGIIVDDTIHLIFAYRHYAEDSVQTALESAGPAMFSTSLILCLGFLVMGLAQIKSISYFGLYTFLMIFFAYLADAFLLPVLLFKKRRTGRKRR